MSRVGPHLITIAEVKYCSVCREPFPQDSKPSVSKAFVAHVREQHRKPEPAKLSGSLTTSSPPLSHEG